MKLKKFLKKFYKLGLLFCILFSVIYVKNNYFFAEVIGPSMLPTLSMGQRIMCTKNIDDLGINDIIVFQKDGENIVKRIVAAEGDYYCYRKMDSSFYTSPLITKNTNRTTASKHGISIFQIQRNFYFTEGDNSALSVDSREFGLISRSCILGKKL